MGGHHLVAHNAGFDRRFPMPSCSASASAPAGFACSLLVSRRVYPDAPGTAWRHWSAQTAADQRRSSPGTGRCGNDRASLARHDCRAEERFPSPPGTVCPAAAAGQVPKKAAPVFLQRHAALSMARRVLLPRLPSEPGCPRCPRRLPDASLHFCPSAAKAAPAGAAAPPVCCPVQSVNNPVSAVQYYFDTTLPRSAGLRAGKEQLWPATSCTGKPLISMPGWRS